QVLVDSEDGAAARLDGRTLEDVIEEEAQALDGARDSAGLDRLPSKVRLREARHRADRVA
ncbi:membrane protein, partial [Streptomyces variegatus]